MDDLDTFLGGGQLSTVSTYTHSNVPDDLASFDPLADLSTLQGSKSTPQTGTANDVSEFDPFGTPSNAPTNKETRVPLKAKKLSFEEVTMPVAKEALAEALHSNQGNKQRAFDDAFDFENANDENFLQFPDLEGTENSKLAAAGDANAFGEEVEYPENDTDIPNPFCYDRFTVARANAVLENESRLKPLKETSVQPRPRPKPQRADSLSGNNPFRKGSFPNDAAPEEDVSNDLENAKGFDPLETIYPESEGEDSDGGKERLNVNISAKKVNTSASSAIPLLPAPPTVEEILAANERGYDPSPTSEDNAADLWNSAQTVTVGSDGVNFQTSWTMNENSDFQLEQDVVETFEPYHCYEKGTTWKLMTRMPEKKVKTKQFSRHLSDRFWKDIYIRVVVENGQASVNLFEVTEEGEESICSKPPSRTIRLEPTMQLSHDKLQQYDKYGKLHIFKINLIEYKEVVGMRTEKMTFKTLQNFMGHKPKGTMVFDHIPVRTEVIKFGSMDKRGLRSLMFALEDALMYIKGYQGTPPIYSKEELCCYAQDEYEAELDSTCNILQQKARTRIFFLAFFNGAANIVLGLNDIWRFGKEVVKRQDIIPVLHDEWIHIYEPEFHAFIDTEEYEKDHLIKFSPSIGCKTELIRFRVSLRNNRELPLTCRCAYKIDKQTVQIRCDLMAPGFFSASKRHGSTHCNNIEIRIPIPEEWIYHFRTDKGSKYGSMHSTLRKPGKIKGFERITQIAQSLLPPSLMETSSGVAKYEHLYKSLVWRIPKLPEKHEGAFKPHLLTCKLLLGAHDVVPELSTLKNKMYVEYSMNSSTVSGATVRSISIENHETNPEKYVKYLAKYEYTVDIHYDIGEHKTTVLKSIWDDISPTEKEENNDSDEEKDVEKKVPSADLDSILLGDSKSDSATAAVSSTPSNPPAHKSNMEDLLDIFSDSSAISGIASSKSANKDILDLDIS